MVWTLNEWWTLIWIVVLMVLTIPLIAWGIGVVIASYFRAKDAHYGRIAGAMAEMLKGFVSEAKKHIEANKEKNTVDAIRKIFEELEEKKEE